MRKLIGYQIVNNDGSNTISESFKPYEVIRDIRIADYWLTLERGKAVEQFNWVLLPIFDGDIEKPVFLEFD